MMKTNLVEQKSMLAKLMAAENISVEHKKIPTAAFDVKNRVLYLPILKWEPGSDVYDLFCAHEVGHALWTPFDGWHSSISEKGKGYKSFLNVIEDARIEKKIKRKFAGARKNMIGGYKELLNADFFGLRKMGVNANDLGLIDRINLYTKAGTDYGIEFTEEEKLWVEKVERTETWEDVVEVTDALYEWCKENESETDNSYGDFDEDDSEDSEWNEDSFSDEDYEDHEEMMKDMPDDDSAEDDSEKDGSSGSGHGEKSDNSSEDGSAGSMNGKSSEDEKSDAGKEDSDDSKDNSKTSNGFEGGHGNPFGDRKMSAPVSLTDDNFREREVEMSDTSSEVIVPNYLSFPKVIVDSVVIDHKTVSNELSSFYSKQEGATDFGNNLLKKFRLTNDKMVNYMVKEFEMKKAANIHRRAYSSKKGMLDMNKVHSYKYNDNLFQQITSFPEGKNHGMVMFIDWSGSMHNCIKDTIEQLINLTMFCSKVQIPFEVYAFTDHYRDWKDCDNKFRSQLSSESPFDENTNGKKIANYKTNEMIIQKNTRMLNLFSSKMNRRELQEAYRHLLTIAEGYADRYAYYYSRNNPYYGMPDNYSLGGTPLNDTIIIAKTLIEEFKIKSRAQIVNAVFLTDGQSNSHNFYLDSSNTVSRFRSHSLHIDDAATRSRVYPINNSIRGRGDVTDLLLLGLKKSTGVNLLGFFLTSGSGKTSVRNLSNVMSNYPTAEEVNKFRKDKFLIDVGTSYDELYIINTKGLEIDEIDHIGEVAAGSSKAILRKALKKNTKGKLQNRILLNAFIEKVA